MTLGKELLNAMPYKEQSDDGIVARFHPNGRLAYVSLHRKGRPRSWAIEIDEKNFSAHATLTKHMSFPDEDAGDKASEASLRAWLEKLILEIKLDSEYKQRCDFCGKLQNEVKKIIAGPTVSICNECVEMCNEVLAA